MSLRRVDAALESSGVPSARRTDARDDVANGWGSVGTGGRRLALIVLAVAMACLAGSCASGQGDAVSEPGDAEVILRLGYAPGAAGAVGQAMEVFAAEVARESDGRVQIEPEASYSGGGPALARDVREGVIDLASIGAPVLGAGGLEAFRALQAPMLIDSYRLAQAVFEGPIGLDMLAGVEEAGVTGLAIHEAGFRKPLGARAPIVAASDWNGLRVGVADAEAVRLGILALGAVPVGIPFADMASALEDRTIDGVETSLGLIQTQGYYRSAGFVTANVNLWPSPSVLVMNRQRLGALSDDHQEVIASAAAVVPGVSVDIVSAPSRLATTLCDEGIRFANAGRAQLDGLERRTAPARARLSRSPVTADYIDRIERLKRRLGTPSPSSPAVPPGCGAP